MRNLVLHPHRIGSDFDAIFDSFFGGNACAPRSEMQAYSPSVDIRETDENISLTFELPGMDKGDIKVLVQDNVLTVSGERKFEKRTEGNGSIRTEIHTGKFSRSFTLPESVDVEKMSADYNNGLLDVVIEKAEEKKPKQVEVTVK